VDEIKTWTKEVNAPIPDIPNELFQSGGAWPTVLEKQIP